MEKLYTCDEIARKYRVQTRTVWDWIRAKKLPALRVGNGYRIREEDLKSFEAERRTIQAENINT